MLTATQEAAFRLSDESANLWDGSMRGADDVLRAMAGTQRLADWNAEHDTAAVLACFDWAIEASA